MLTQVRKTTAQFLGPIVSLPVLDIENLLEIPKKLEHGHLALPIFALAKQLRKAPPLIAKDLSEKIAAQSWPDLLSVTPVGGYINLTFRNEFLQKTLMQTLQQSGSRLGYSDAGQGRTLVIDYSSPNVAKPMHVGHLRATVIGQAIRNLAETQGFKVIGLNHLGDWGVQFGKLAWAYFEWGEQYPFKEKPFQALFDLYVRFHDEAEKNPELEAKGSQVFRRLEEGDAQITELWKKFIEISMIEYGRLWKRLGVRHDLVRGESFYNDRLKTTEKLLEDKGLLVESEGAQVVMLGDEMPPCLIRKSDGASLYATRDLASAIYRHDELHADLNLYVVGADQTLHFRQVFAVLNKLGFAWAKDCHHIGFGMYRFKDVGKMSTRRGHVIFLEDVLNQAVEQVERIIEQKNPTLADRALVAEQVGVGAIIFNDLVNDRVKNVDFDWTRVLDFEGDSGPYVQYCHVRCLSLLKKSGAAESDYKMMSVPLESDEERELIRVLLNYQDVLAAAFNGYRPNVLAQYLLDICQAFNHFYHKHRILGLTGEGADEIRNSRLALVSATQHILKSGLGVLNIQAPEAM
jgi:arginyl-tRNA synthetase